MTNLLDYLDPYRQSFLYFKWNFWSILLVAIAFCWLAGHTQGPLMHHLLDNRFVYLPNYLTHEFSHRFWCPWGWEWWCYASGNAMETLIPLGLCVWLLRLRGGRYLLPFSGYWLATTLYGAGVYASDARAMQLPLTSSDMMSNFAPGTIKGDWYYILEPLGLLPWDVVIGKILIGAGILCLLLSIFSLWYYWMYYEQYLSDGHWN